MVIDDATGRDFIAKRLGKFQIIPGNITKEPFGVAFRKMVGAFEARAAKLYGATDSLGSSSSSAHSAA